MGCAPCAGGVVVLCAICSACDAAMLYAAVRRCNAAVLYVAVQWCTFIECIDRTHRMMHSTRRFVTRYLICAFVVQGGQLSPTLQLSLKVRLRCTNSC